MSNNNSISLKEFIEKLDNKIDKLDTRLDSIDKTLIKQESELAEHIYRTQINEENIDLLREQIRPISKHVDMVHGVLKFIGLIALLGGIVESVFKVLDFFS